MKSTLLFSLLIPLLISMPVQAASSTSSAQTADEKQIRAQADQYARAFTVGDTRAIVNMFSPDAVLLMSDGHELKGRDQIEQQYTGLFASAGGQPMQINIESIKFPSATVAVETGTSTLAGTVPTASRYTAIHAKRGGRWVMTNVTETPFAGSLDKDYVHDLDWLIGTWYTGMGKDRMQIHADWMENKRFILCTSTAADSGKVVDEQIIGWDPASQSLTSWHFSSTGGFGRARWTRDGGNWIARAIAVQPDGSMGQATYVMQQRGNDAFSWRSVRRNLDGTRLPDLKEVSWSRTK